MSVSVNLAGKPNQPKQTILGTSVGDIFAPSGTGNFLVMGIRVVNQDVSNPCRVNLYWTDKDGNDKLFFTDEVAAGDPLPMIDDPFVVSGDGAVRKLRGSAANASDLVVTVYMALLPQ